MEIYQVRQLADAIAFQLEDHISDEGAMLWANAQENIELYREVLECLITLIGYGYTLPEQSITDEEAYLIKEELIDATGYYLNALA